MTKKDTSLDDIAIAIGDLATLVDDRFSEVGDRLSGLEGDNATLRVETREIREWLVRIDNRLTGVESDIGEIYDRIVALEAKVPNLTTANKKTLERDIAALFEWAKKVSKETGVPLPKV